MPVEPFGGLHPSQLALAMTRSLFFCRTIGSQVGTIGVHGSSASHRPLARYSAARRAQRGATGVNVAAARLVILVMTAILTATATLIVGL